MSSNESGAGADMAVDRWTLSRDIAVLQVKLIVDGLRDFILVPISIVVGLYSLTQTGKPGDNEFYHLLRVGKRSERWINLFGAAERARAPEVERVNFPDEDIDSLVTKFEEFVVDEYKSGGVTRQAKEHLDQMLSNVGRRRRRKKSNEPPAQ